MTSLGTTQATPRGPRSLITSTCFGIALLLGVWSCGEPVDRDLGRAPFEAAARDSTSDSISSASAPGASAPGAMAGAAGGGAAGAGAGDSTGGVGSDDLDSLSGRGSDSLGAATMRTAAPLPAGPFFLADGTPRPNFRRPGAIRGVYLNAWNAGSTARVGDMLEVARTTEINSFVIDIKDATGFVSHRSAIPEVDSIGALGELRIRDLPGLLRRLEADSVWPIARIVIVKDPILIAARPELAVQDTAGGVWKDSKGFVWLNPYNRGMWDYHVELAKEVARMGFPEIQWDYVRFPDASQSDLARAEFPGDSLGSRQEAIRAFLGYARAELASLGMDVRMTADVFGMTTSIRHDPGIGQVWESFIDQVDAALPMVYPSHYWAGNMGIAVPNAQPYEIVRAAIRDARVRSEAVEGGGTVVAWLQDFTLGAPRYGAPEVRAQIQGTYDAGVREWIMWNPGSRYTIDAFEPIGGFAQEPMIRVGDGIVPVSRRFDVLGERDPATIPVDSVSSGESVQPDSGLVVPDSGSVAADSASVVPDSGRVVADTASVDPDSGRVVADTTGGGRPDGSPLVLRPSASRRPG